MTRPELTLIESGSQASREAAAWFARLCADDVSEADRAGHAAWMASHPEHRLAYQKLEQLWSSLGGFANAPELEPLIRGLPTPVVRARTRTAPTQRPAAARRWAMAAAAAVVAIAASLLVVKREPQIVPVEYATTHGERRWIDLEDGSRMDLDAQTKVQVLYGPSSRTIVLQAGRAFFKVAKDPARPFEVVSDQGSARALGTQFETSLTGNSLDVALYEGRVALLAPASGGAQTTPTHLGTLTAGQAARIQGDRMALSARRVENGGTPGWMSGNLVFSDTPLSEAVAEFNRYSPRTIVLANATLADVRVSGVFRGNDADGFIEALQDVYGIRARDGENASRVLHSAQ